MRKSTILPVLIVGALLVAFQLAASATDRSFYLTEMVVAAYSSIVVLGLCLLLGYAGQVSLGHGAFFAIGGYCSAVLTTRQLAVAPEAGWGRLLLRLGLLASRSDTYGDAIVTVSPGAAFAAAMVMALAVAVLIGYPALRLKGHYLAMATLGFGLIVYRILLGCEFTGGADGIAGVPPWRLPFGLTVSWRKPFRVQNYYLSWGLALATLALLLNVVRSRTGRALRAMHGSELAANTMGVNTPAHKLQAFVLSAVLAAAAGCFMTHYNGGIGPSEAGAMKSVRYVALVAAGGMANLWGVLVISAVLNFLSLRGYFGTLDHAVFGIILIAIISLAPQGPLRPVGVWLRRLGAGRTARRTGHASA